MIICEDYNREFKRQLLQLQEDLLMADIHYYSIKNEAVLTESTELVLLAEEEKEKNKVGFFKGLINSLKEIWGRFVENFKKLMSSDGQWLADNEQRLLKTNIKDMQYNMFPYWKGIQYMTSLKIPQFNPNDSSLMEALKTKENYITYIVDKNLSSVKKQIDPSEFSESLKSIFRGGEAILMEDRDIAQNLKSMINYCKNANSIMNGVKADQKKIENAVNQAIKEATTAKNQSASQANKSESVYIMLEADGKKVSDNNIEKGNAKGATSPEEVNRANSNLNNMAKKSGEKLTKKVDAAKENIDKSNVDKDDFKKDLSYEDKTNRYSVYATVSQTVLGAKMSIYEERYKAYMKLLTTIVKRNHNADVKDSKDKMTFNTEVTKKAKELMKSTKTSRFARAKLKPLVDILEKAYDDYENEKSEKKKQRLAKQIKEHEEDLQIIVDKYYNSIG